MCRLSTLPLEFLSPSQHIIIIIFKPESFQVQIHKMCIGTTHLALQMGKTEGVKRNKTFKKPFALTFPSPHLESQSDNFWHSTYYFERIKISIYGRKMPKRSIETFILQHPSLFMVTQFLEPLTCHPPSSSFLELGSPKPPVPW